MTFTLTQIAIPGATSDEFGVRVAVDDGSQHFALARYSKPDGADASMFGVACHVRAVGQDGTAVLRMSGRVLSVSHPASIDKASHRLDPEGETTKLMRLALDGAINAMLQELAVEVGNRTMLAGMPR